ncbi:putative PIN domain containing protein [Leishmania naiffi]|uniref:PIN domain containing protein n=1 Tax=Leishmania naiffi TaxID=5678 RepID=A0AAW3C235_9TRYP
MRKPPKLSERRGRCLPDPPLSKPKPAEQPSPGERKSGQPELTSSTPSVGTSSSGCGDDTSLSSSLLTHGTTRERRTHRSPSHSRIQSGGGFRYLRAATATPDLAPSSAGTSMRLGSKAATFSPPPASTSLPKELREDTTAWPLEKQPLTHTSRSFSLNSSTPAESSLARLRALAGLAPLQRFSYDSQMLSPELYGNEESPLRHSCDVRAELGGSGPSSSAPSSCVSSPYTPDLVQRLSFLNGTSAQATLAVLQSDRLKRSRSDALMPPSLPIAQSFQSEGKSAGQQCKGPPTVPTANDTATSAGGSPFAESLGLASLRASALTPYRNEKDVDSGHSSGTASDSAQSTASALSRLRAANQCIASAAENCSNQHPYITSKNGVAGVGPAVDVAPAPHELPTGSQRRAAAALLTPTHLAVSSLSPGPGLPQPSIVSARLAQLRQRAPTSPTSLSPYTKTVAPVTSRRGTVQAPLPPSFINLSRLRRLENLQQPSRQPSTPQSDASPSEDRECKSLPSPAATLEAALEHAPQYRLLAEATVTRGEATPVPSAAVHSDKSDLDPAEVQKRDAPLPTPANVLASYQTSAKQNVHHAAAKMGVRRARARKGAVAMKAKKERAVEAVVLKGTPAKGTRGKTRLANSPVWAKQLSKLRSLAAPVPVGETASERYTEPISNSFVSAVAPPLHSPPEHSSQHLSSVVPTKSDKALLKRSVSSLPPSWSTSSPFAALASPSLHAALTQASAGLVPGRESADSIKFKDGVRDDEKCPRESTSSSFASVSPYYCYPSMMTRSTTAAAAAALVAADNRTVAATTVTTSSMADTTELSSQPHMRTASTASRKSRDDSSALQCVIFDTSSLLDSEPGVMNLVLEKWFVGIPFTVLDELDRMHKDRGGGGGSGKSDHGATTAAAAAAPAPAGVSGTHDREWRRQRAHELRNWIAACLSDAAQGRLLLQKRTEVVQAYDMHATTNDDRILGYAVYLKQQRAATVLFVTEDKFLRIKASSELGKAYAYSDIRKLVGMPPLPKVSSTASQEKRSK